MKSLLKESNCRIYPDGDISNELCRLKFGLLSAMKARLSRLIVFSSATRREGNTTVLSYFGQHLARSGENVILLDANLRHPSMHEIFNVQKSAGLAEIVLEGRGLEECLKPIQGSLSVITSGHADPDRTGDILESESFDHLLIELWCRPGWVLCDSAPVTLYNDATLLATKLDGIVMTLKAESTRQEVAETAKKRLERAGANIIGMVLNRRQQHIPGWLYNIFA